MHIQSIHEIATQPYDTDQIPLKYVTPGFKLCSILLIPILSCYKEVIPPHHAFISDLLQVSNKGL